jgi:L-ascorbate metabolism protein UlaG (beta-lactamase superfamily)
MVLISNDFSAFHTSRQISAEEKPMQITHFCNSCINIEAGETRLLCDPWIGPADTNAWLSFPFNSEGPAILERLKPTYIYISHLHPDHHDEKTLQHLPRDTPIVIKKFKDHRLASKLTAQGFDNVIELDAWTPLIIDEDIEVAIVPSTSMVKEGIDSAISYDIDTSIIVKCLQTGQIFFNNVDNPTSLAALKDVHAFCQKIWGKAPDIACLPIGAASEYPHCFMNIDRVVAGRRIIDASLDGLQDRIDALGCTDFFAAGGTYVIRGKFSALNKFIAQPSADEIETQLAPWVTAGNRYFKLEGGSGAEFDTAQQQWQPCVTGFEKTADKAAYGAAAAAIDVDYATDCRSGNISFEASVKRMETALVGARQNYDAVMARIGITPDWAAEIHLYADLKLDADGNMLAGQQPGHRIDFACQKAPSRQMLSFHMDIDLFVDLIEGRGNWNGALSGTYIMYERTPDFFLPDIPFSMNFLVDRRPKSTANTA